MPINCQVIKNYVCLLINKLLIMHYLTRRLTLFTYLEWNSDSALQSGINDTKKNLRHIYNFIFLDLWFFWPAEVAKVAENATFWYLRGADCLKSGDLLYMGNPHNVGVNRLHFSATLAAFKGHKILDREKLRHRCVLKFHSLLKCIVRIQWYFGWYAEPPCGTT
jgi:hypothetical protein